MDIDDYYRIKKEHNGHAVAPDYAARMFQQAEVLAQNLTGDPIWDTFLSYLQAAVETARGDEARILSSLTADGLVETDEMLKLKIVLARTRERLAVLDAVIGLPRDLKELGERARSINDRLQ